MSPGPWQLVIILIIILVLFGGRGKISALMGDFGKGLKSFKKGMKDDASEVAEDGDDTKTLKSEQVDTADTETQKEAVTKD
ncbi:MAG: twin-arginine translocase TatA/TatE family subunit [Alphaproteobacteria bacterium]|jgi:sec-independent protein translocase protein TatA|nr:twin-arginine translocase TatA/TatE family subunit [Alphaproteobacteria bacterium]MBT7942133.1 twin-arginine translocase TatA/TatE family subunit [Alphaproteobacteria bacterium]